MASDVEDKDDDTTSTDESGEAEGAGARDESGSSDESSEGTAADAGDASDSEADDGRGQGEVAASAPASASPGGGKKPSRLSPGARVAAAKAAKAAMKAVKRAQNAANAESVTNPGGGAPSPDEAPIEQLKASSVGQAAARAGEWANANQAIALGVAAALVLGLGGFAGWRWYSGEQDLAAGALLTEAVEIATAEVTVPDEDGAADEDDATDDDDAAGERTFESATARSSAALTAYRRVVAEYPGSHAASWARLGEARTLAETGDAEGARAAYALAVREHGDDPLVALRAYEGAGFSYEAEEDWDHAREEYESIEGLDGGAYRVVGGYHLARLRIATGDRIGAQTALEELIEQIESAGSNLPESPFPYLLAQAQARLRELDPSSASGSDAPITIGGPGGGGLPEGISPEVMEALRRAMAGAEGAGAPE